jgi:hypothetical protein
VLEGDVQKAEKQFVNGVFLWPVHKNAPKFVKLDISFRAVDFVEFLNKNVDEKGYMRVTVKESKDGRLYCELNNYEATMEQLTKK